MSSFDSVEVLDFFHGRQTHASEHIPPSLNSFLYHLAYCQYYCDLAFGLYCLDRLAQF